MGLSSSTPDGAADVPSERPPDHVPVRAVARRVLLYLGVFTLVVTMIGVPLYKRYERGLRTTAVEEQTRTVKSVDALVHGELFGVMREIRSLSRVPGVRDFLEDPTDEKRRRLDAFFTDLSHSLMRYDQLRILDMGGMERVRVDNRDGVVRVVPPADLQDKSDRYYVQETLALDVGEVYASPLDLNVEHGAVEEPYVPMLRFGALVEGSDGEPTGLVVMNYKAELLLDAILRRLGATNDYEHLLVNADGYFLLGPSPEAEWGWQIGRPDATLANRYPDVAAAVDPVPDDHAAHQVSYPGGTALIMTLEPFAFSADDAPGATPADAVNLAGAAVERARWTVVSLLPHAVVLAPSPMRQPIGWFVAAVVLVSMLVASYAVATQRVERRAFERARERDAREIEDLYENAPVGYHTTDCDGRIRRINRTELAWLGYDREDVVGRMSLLDLMAPESREAAAAYLGRLQRCEDTHDVQLVMQRKDGTTLPVALTSTALTSQSGDLTLARTSVVDISERRRLESALRQRANTDALTGIMNRPRFYEVASVALSRASASGTPISLLLLDIDHFKSINDRYGHHAGDAALAAFAATCAAELRDRDLFARVGGEEFVVLVPGASLEVARRVAERLRAAVERAHVEAPGVGRIEMTCSVGVAGASSDVRTLDALVKAADDRLYEAKVSGRNQVAASAEGGSLAGATTPA